jgi:glycine/D-amino acid oxidase-like deaminating enzyme
MSLSLPRSLWAATAQVAPPTPPLQGEARAELAIVGGGFTGLSAALHAAEAGADVALLEAGEPGWGASGRNGGQVIPGLKHLPSALEAKFGPDLGARMAEFSQGSADFLFRLIERHRIDCNAVRTGWIRAAHSQRALEETQAQGEELRSRGAPVELLDRAAIERLTGTDGYLGGFLDRRGGALNPLGLARGIAKAAQAAGARIHDASPARRLERDGEGWCISTNSGTVHADRVILATNAYTDELWPGLRRTVIPVTSVQVATTPLSDNVRGSILPEGHVLSDTRRLLLYFRLDPHGRLVFGGRGSVRDAAEAAAQERIDGVMRSVFPRVAEQKREFAWAGKVAVNLDVLPHVSRLAPGLFSAMGYNGRGVAMATTLGAAVGKQVARQLDPFPFPVEEMRPIPLHALRLPIIAAAAQYYRLRDALGW